MCISSCPDMFLALVSTTQFKKRGSWCPAYVARPSSIFDGYSTLLAKQMTTWLFPRSDRSCPHCIDWPKKADWTGTSLLGFISSGLLLHLQFEKYMHLHIGLKTLFSTCLYLPEQASLLGLPPPECPHPVQHHFQ